MSDFDNTNRGALWKNKNRKTDSHPNLQGKLNINGEEYYLSAWTKVSSSGSKWLSLSLGDKIEAAAPADNNADDIWDD